MSGLPDRAFETAALREAVLRAWRDSPTRLTEDTNAERDLRVGGYRDRLFVELAQNAADAAALAGVAGRVRVRIVDGELRVANTGRPLDEPGVAALASLRASAKPEGTVGRFGVGFAAVLAVTVGPRVVSRTGGVAFSEERTRAAAGADDVPVLRLPWELEAGEPPVPDGFDTEVRLPLEVDAGEVLATITAEVADLLLALPALESVDVEGRRWERRDAGSVVELSTPDDTTRWSVHRDGATTWAVPVDADGVPRPRAEDVLHTPTPTDERLSLPARLLAAVPVEPSRRRVLAGAGTREALAAAARAYPGLVRTVAREYRTTVVPAAGFPLSDVDAELRELVVDALSEQDWVPAAGGAELSGRRCRVLTVEAPALVALLADVVPGLAADSGPDAARTLESVGAAAMDIAEIVDVLTGVDRDPTWWTRVYDALLDGVESHRVDTAELGALPVPLVDGRTVPGPRGVLLVDADTLGEADELVDAGVVGLHVVHPDAAHPLLTRLGAVRAGAAELLDAPAMREAVERSVDDAESGVDVRPLVEVVLRLAAAGGDPAGLGALALPGRSGPRRADELVLPDAPLLDVFDPEALGADGPLDVLDAEFAAGHGGPALEALGVVGTFALVTDDEPTDADHDLPDEQSWWEETQPTSVLAVRDLDLVADDAWPAALRLLAGRPETWRALTLPGGHTPWWLARYAVLAGRAPRDWRMPGARGLEGLFDPVPDVDISPSVLVAVGVRTELTAADVTDADDAADVCDRLADPARDVPLPVTLRAHGVLAEATAHGSAFDPPERVRALDGTVADADDAAVLDGPWLLGVLPAGRLVALGGNSDEDAPADPAALADVLDLPLATSVAGATVDSDGEFAEWTDLPALVEVAALLGLPLPDGGVVVHEQLVVTAGDTETPVPWWCDPDHVVHAADTSEGLARAFAWAAGAWARRRDVEALLDDPTPDTLLA
ncbi:molecular chaperone Hsp90 [Saccharomonospora sp. CUA-673]|uniref:sacsin N-terminal ATP-binding-like domain-containing protein n=1 Tax=Saccharomonospora sp. CUA-673 TaxID=1904969 RepID=UPI0009669525|nr:molecular chaperone Hsp90 [Saccharomonospora sp. CUA-673]OLT43869.1 molecular chaperone Hsp90 [Saccharomonospora sp. CUA-673]